MAACVYLSGLGANALAQRVGTGGGIGLPRGGDSSLRDGVTDGGTSGNEPPPRLRRFLAFSFEIGDLATRPDRGNYFDLLVAQYNTGPTCASTPGHFELWRNYRQEVLARNPAAVLGVYYSAITTQCPTQASQYAYPQYDYQGDNFLCDDPASAGVYDPRPDDFGFFSPLYLSQRADWEPWGVGAFGRWPYYYFAARGWVLPQTTYICRPIIDIGNPAVATFVSNALVSSLATRHPLANAVSFDNSAMLENEYHRWPGWGQPQSPYGSRQPDADFFTYLDTVRAALHAHGAKLMVNASAFAQLGPHVDIVFYEGGIRRTQTPAQVRTLLSGYRAALQAGAGVTHRWLREGSPAPLSEVHEELMFFLASSLLVYEENRFGVDLDMTGGQLDYYSQYFLLPTWLMDPLESYRELRPNVYARRFQNGIVLLNAGSQRERLSETEYQAGGLAAYAAPRALRAHSGVVVILDCARVQGDAACGQLYMHPASEPPIALGDLNCDEAVDYGDYSAFLTAWLDPVAYAVQFPSCDRWAADMDQSGAIDATDYDIFYYTAFHNGEPPTPGLPGDMNCDGYLNNFDIDGLIQALLGDDFYNAAYPNCNRLLADIDSDGTVTNFDLDEFINELLGG